MKRISIVTPSYNQGIYIEDTIKSIWFQKGNFELEHIIADGGSTDETINIIKKYDNIYRAKKYPFKCNKFIFKWWSKKDNGQTDAIIKGFKLSTGQIINWVNSDDVLLRQDGLATILRAFINSSADIVVGKGMIIDEPGKKIGSFALLEKIKNDLKFQDKLPLILKGDFLCQQSLFFKKELMDKSPLDPKLHYCMDWDLYINFYRNNFKFHFINNVIGAIREQPDAKTVIMPVGVFQERLAIYQKNKIWSAGRIHSYLKIAVADFPYLYSFIDKLANLISLILVFYRNRRIY